MRTRAVPRAWSYVRWSTEGSPPKTYGASVAGRITMPRLPRTPPAVTSTPLRWFAVCRANAVQTGSALARVEKATSPTAGTRSASSGGRQLDGLTDQRPVRPGPVARQHRVAGQHRALQPELDLGSGRGRLAEAAQHGVVRVRAVEHPAVPVPAELPAVDRAAVRERPHRSPDAHEGVVVLTGGCRQLRLVTAQPGQRVRPHDLPARAPRHGQRGLRRHRHRADRPVLGGGEPPSGMTVHSRTPARARSTPSVSTNRRPSSAAAIPPSGRTTSPFASI